MSSELNWKYPDWIYAAKHKLNNIDTSKFLFPIYISHTVISPDKNKYVPRWAIVVKIQIDAKDRINGKTLKIISSVDGIYIYRSSDVEDVIFEEITGLIEHELCECFQIKELGGKGPTIPFDPHTFGKNTSLYSFRKVNGFRYHPTFRSYAWAKSKEVAQYTATKICTLVSKMQALPPARDALCTVQ